MKTNPLATLLIGMSLLASTPSEAGMIFVDGTVNHIQIKRTETGNVTYQICKINEACQVIGKAEGYTQEELDRTLRLEQWIAAGVGISGAAVVYGVQKLTRSGIQKAMRVTGWTQWRFKRRVQAKISEEVASLQADGVEHIDRDQARRLREQLDIESSNEQIGFERIQSEVIGAYLAASAWIAAAIYDFRLNPIARWNVASTVFSPEMADDGSYFQFPMHSIEDVQNEIERRLSKLDYDLFSNRD